MLAGQMLIILARTLNSLVYHKLYEHVNKKKGGLEAAPKKSS